MRGKPPTDIETKKLRLHVSIVSGKPHVILYVFIQSHLGRKQTSEEFILSILQSYSKYTLKK